MKMHCQNNHFQAEDVLKHHTRIVPMELMPQTGQVYHHTKHHSVKLQVFGSLKLKIEHYARHVVVRLNVVAWE